MRPSVLSWDKKWRCFFLTVLSYHGIPVSHTWCGQLSWLRGVRCNLGLLIKTIHQEINIKLYTTIVKVERFFSFYGSAMLNKYINVVCSQLIRLRIISEDLMPDKLQITHLYTCESVSLYDIMTDKLFITFSLFLLCLGLSGATDCDETTSATIYTLLDILENDTSVQQQVRATLCPCNVDLI